MEKVAIVKCSSYEQKKVDKAVRSIFEMLGVALGCGSKVLIKPNVVTAQDKNQVAISTNPSVVEAVCKVLKKRRCKIYIGESSFMDTDEFLKKAGIEKVAKKYAVKKKPIYFEQEKFRYIKDKKAKTLKRFPIAKIVKEVDLIINMPKLKTHILTKYTGAVKNLYGLIPGGLKQRLHNKAKGDKNFSNLLVDIYQNIKPELNIMDGVVGMEGHGPTSGKPKKANLILGSKNAIALDIAASKIIGLTPKSVNTTKEAIRRKLYSNFNFKLVGMKKLPEIHFRKPRGDARLSRLRRAVREKPIVVNKKRCIKCGRCRDRCPVKAITLKPYPVIDKKKCIRCFCCMEICPKDALHLEGEKD